MDQEASITPETHISAGFVVQIVALVAACLLTYAAVNARVSVVEAQQMEVKQQLQQIDTSLRGINQNIYELLKLEAASHATR